jgi:hypothetical protein
MMSILALIISLSCLSQEKREQLAILVPSEERLNLKTLEKLSDPWGLLWRPGQTINIKFLNGSTWQQEQVKKYAIEWTYYANLKFNFIEYGFAHIKIGFADDNESWSQIGKNSLQISQSNESMHFGGIEETSEPKVIKRVVLHEFGHALGFGHEHQNPLANIDWHESKVYEHYSDQFTKEEIRRNVLTKIKSSIYSDFDPQSIMMYGVQSDDTKTGEAYPSTYELSEIDKQVAEVIYPFSSTFPCIANLYIPSAYFNSVIVDHNIYRRGAKGMLIHINIETYNLLEAKCKLTAYFSFDGGQALNDYNDNYCTTDGKVAISIDLKPNYQDAIFSDVTLFMPYDELHLANGVHNLYFELQLISNNRLVHWSNPVYFTVTK